MQCSLHKDAYKGGTQLTGSDPDILNSMQVKGLQGNHSSHCQGMYNLSSFKVTQAAA